jgi:hypothetical protein
MLPLPAIEAILKALDDDVRMDESHISSLSSFNMPLTAFIFFLKQILYLCLRLSLEILSLIGYPCEMTHNALSPGAAVTLAVTPYFMACAQLDQQL